MFSIDLMQYMKERIAYYRKRGGKRKLEGEGERRNIKGYQGLNSLE